MTRIHVRAATIMDVPALAKLHAACFEDSWSAQSMMDVLTSPGARAWLAVPDSPIADVKGDSAIGFAIDRVAADEAELLTLGVLAAYRRQGIATQLLTEVVKDATARGARSLFLEVAEDNHGAQALYASQGFAMIGRRPDYYRIADRPPVAALTLRRVLAPRWRLGNV